MMDALRWTLPSAFPAVVFSRLAALCVPAFSDRCHILIDEDGLGIYRIQRPLFASTPDLDGHCASPHRTRDAWSGQWVSDHTVLTAFEQTPTVSDIGYRGSVLHLWDDGYHPTGTDVALAQLVVDHAVAMMRRERELNRGGQLPPTPLSSVPGRP